MVGTALVTYYCIGILVAVMAALGVVWLGLHFRLALNRVLLAALCLSSAYLLVFQYLKYRSFHFYADFSHWAQLIHAIAQTGKPFVLNMEFLVPGSLNYFSVHFVPLTYVLAGIFKLFPFVGTIMVLNFLIMVSSVIPLYKLSLQFYKDRFFAILCCFLFLWYPAFQYTVLYEFEMLRFSIPVILWMLYFEKAGKRALYYVFVILAICVREEVGLTIFMFGLYLLFLEKKRWRGFITALVGIAAFELITLWVMPSFRGSGTYAHIASGSFIGIGSSPQEVVVNLFCHPLSIIKTVFNPIKLANMFMFFAPLLFIPFLSPYLLLCALPSIAIGVLSSSYTHSSFLLYYMSAMVPFIFYAFIKAWPGFVEIVERFQKRIYAKSKTPAYDAACLMVFLAAFSTNLFFGPSFLSLQFWFRNLKPAPFHTQNFHFSVYARDKRLASAEEILDRIPKDAIVSTQQFFHTRLYQKKGALIFPALKSMDGKFEADYVFFDAQNYDLSAESPAFISSDKFDRIKNNAKEWQLVGSKDNYFLYKRRLTRKDIKKVIR